jgi:hypothetical protein
VVLSIREEKMNFEVSREEEINQILMGKPHVVILGAGASYAAFPDGDKFGRKLPLMNNLIQILELEDILSQSDIEFESSNFEDVYSELHQNKSKEQVRIQVEDRVYDYFSEMLIKDEPTIYDHLLLALRGKDVIATFNWDPFLIQAYARNAGKFSLPRLLFLHGNVAIGVCYEDNVVGGRYMKCSKCKKPFQPVQLLYPIKQKNYHEDSYLSAQWKELESHMKGAFMITMFGYGAPKSDISAIELLKSAWGKIEKREMEQTEIIDIRSEEDLHETWKPFIHSHHYDIYSSFYDSWIAKHPRRTGEAYWNQYYEAMFIDDNPIPHSLNFEDLWNWFGTLYNVEQQKSKDT